MAEVKVYGVLGGDSTYWYPSEEDVITALSEEDPGSLFLVFGLTYKFDQEVGSIGDIALTAMFEYVVPGVG